VVLKTLNRKFESLIFNLFSILAERKIIGHVGKSVTNTVYELTHIFSLLLSSGEESDQLLLSTVELFSFLWWWYWLDRNSHPEHCRKFPRCQCCRWNYLAL